MTRPERDLYVCTIKEHPQFEHLTLSQLRLNDVTVIVLQGDRVGNNQSILTRKSGLATVGSVHFWPQTEPNRTQLKVLAWD